MYTLQEAIATFYTLQTTNAILYTLQGAIATFYTLQETIAYLYTLQEAIGDKNKKIADLNAELTNLKNTAATGQARYLQTFIFPKAYDK